MQFVEQGATDIGRAACAGMLDLSLGRRPRGVVNPEVFDRPGFVRKWERLRVGDGPARTRPELAGEAAP